MNDAIQGRQIDFEYPPVHVDARGVSFIKLDELARSAAFWREIDRTLAMFAPAPTLPEQRSKETP